MSEHSRFWILPHRILTSPARIPAQFRRLYEWEKFPVLCKWTFIGGTCILGSLVCWISYREKSVTKKSLILSPVDGKSLPKAMESSDSTGDVASNKGEIDENSEKSRRNSDRSQNDSIKEESNIAAGDNEVALSIHSQITRGLHDLQRGLELSKLYKERNTKRIRRHSAHSSVDSSPIKRLSPDDCGDTLNSGRLEVSREGTPLMKPPSHPPRTRPSKSMSNSTSARRRLISTSSTKSKTSSSNEIMEEVTNILKSSDRLDRMMRYDDAISRILSHIRSDSDSSSNESDRTLRNSGSLSSIDSFMTACDEFEYTNFPFLTKGMDLADVGLVDSRKIRYQLFGQRSEREFLGKLYCIRKAENAWLSDSASRNWLRDTGRDVVSGLLSADGTDPEPFEEAYDALVDWAWRFPDKMMQEMNQVRVTEISFFDIVLDWCILDSLDALATPPSSITSVMGNRWLGNDFKRTGMTSAVWSYIQKRKSQLSSVDSFMGRFYDMANTVTPTIAWGLLGPKTEYTELCRSFRAEVITLCQELFSYRDAWRSESALKADIRELISETFKRLLNLLEESQKKKFIFKEPPVVY